jgi:hypothetical protein
MADANERDVHECDMETFMSHYLPFEPPPALVDAAMNALQAKNTILLASNRQKRGKGGKNRKVPEGSSTGIHTAGLTGGQSLWAHKKCRPHAVTGGFQWAESPMKTPPPKATEDIVFKPLIDVCNTLRTVSCAGYAPNLTMEIKSRRTTESEVEGSTHMVDGFLRPYDRTINYPVDFDPPKPNKFRTAEIAVTFEFKLLSRDSMALDVRSAVCCCCFRIHCSSRID